LTVGVFPGPELLELSIGRARATEVRAQYGLEGAAASLGDTVEAAKIYAERNQQLAKRIAREIG
jgi:hypothetical protein